MAKTARIYREVWGDRFSNPTVEDLLSSLQDETTGIVTEARNYLLELPGVSEEVHWYGLPWCWTMTFTCEKTKDIPWAYLVPNPQGAIVSLPMKTELRTKLLAENISRSTTHILEESKTVNGTAWINLPLATEDDLESVKIVVGHKRAFLKM
ncbi:MAG TPA: DUF3788 family protein [Phycisphaeraceae bacterium]|nr:DUF3788 family protein [Phycisphaeraceae bacterium]